MNEDELTEVDKKTNEVVIHDINIPFGKLIAFFVKSAFAAIPAFIIVAILLFVIQSFIASFFIGVSMHR